MSENESLKSYILNLEQEKNSDSQKFSKILLQITDQLTVLKDLKSEIKDREQKLDEKDRLLNSERSQLIEEVGEELAEEIQRLKTQRNSSETMIYRESFGEMYKEYSEDQESDNEQGYEQQANSNSNTHFLNNQVKIKIEEEVEYSDSKDNSDDQYRNNSSENEPEPKPQIFRVEKSPMQNLDTGRSKGSRDDKESKLVLIVRVKELEELNEILKDENIILRRKIDSLDKQLVNSKKREGYMQY